MADDTSQKEDKKRLPLVEFFLFLLIGVPFAYLFFSLGIVLWIVLSILSLIGLVLIFIPESLQPQSVRQFFDKFRGIK